ncbi:hypothetical protein [Kitasatospora griseola]
MPVLASPKALHTALADLFAGREFDLPARAEQWAPDQADTLID